MPRYFLHEPSHASHMGWLHLLQRALVCCGGDACLQWFLACGPFFSCADFTCSWFFFFFFCCSQALVLFDSDSVLHALTPGFGLGWQLSPIAELGGTGG